MIMNKLRYTSVSCRTQELAFRNISQNVHEAAINMNANPSVSFSRQYQIINSLSPQRMLRIIGDSDCIRMMESMMLMDWNVQMQRKSLTSSDLSEPRYSLQPFVIFVASLQKKPIQRSRLMPVITLLTVPDTLIIEINKHYCSSIMLEFLNLIGWCFILIKFSVMHFHSQTLADDLFNLRIVQCIQIFTTVTNFRQITDLLFLVFNFKMVIRLIIVWIFFNEDMHQEIFYFVALVWASWECVRFLVQNVRSSITQHIFNNAFILLQPLEVYADITVINLYLQQHASTIQKYQTILARVFQGFIVIFMAITFIGMWNERQRFYVQRRHRINNYRD